MKKFIIAAALFLMSLCFGGNTYAGNFGVVGGASFHTYSPADMKSHTLTQWHAGVVYKINLPVGFQIQPTALYHVKPAATDVAPVDLTVGNVELMASIQWGVDLILFRPFVEVSPFIGCATNSWGSLSDLWKKEGGRFECGLGVGGGLQVWRFQINARYNWNRGNILPPVDASGVLGKPDFNNVTLSLAYFF
jgi:hypothetical protein